MWNHGEPTIFTPTNPRMNATPCLRYTKLSITPDDRLMLVAGGSVYGGTRKLKSRIPRVAFSKDGHEWTATRKVLSEGEWLWRVTWHDGRAYGASYNLWPIKGPDIPEDERTLKLYTSKEGLDWHLLATLAVPNKPNETTLRFLASGEMMALVRRESGNRRGWVGTSKPPFAEWSWKEATLKLGGPNFIQLPDGSLIAGSRGPGKEDDGTHCILARLTADSYEPILELPSGGDCSYPGLVWHEGLLWVSYYSSHEGKASIYLAKVRLPSK